MFVFAELRRYSKQQFICLNHAVSLAMLSPSKFGVDMEINQNKKEKFAFFDRVTQTALFTADIPSSLALMMLHIR